MFKITVLHEVGNDSYLPALHQVKAALAPEHDGISIQSFSDLMWHENPHNRQLGAAVMSAECVLIDQHCMLTKTGRAVVEASILHGVPHHYYNEEAKVFGLPVSEPQNPA